MPARGLLMCGSHLGSTSRRRREEMTSINANRRKSKMTYSIMLLFSIYCILFTFASINKQFTIASHNLHSYKKSSTFHKQCIDSYGGVWMAQELWLPENRLSQLTSLGVQFVARSGMEDAVSSGIMRGRPYGGVSIAWSPDMDHVIKPLINYRHKRIVCVEISADPHPLLLISVYMPFYDASKRTECMAETADAIAMLEEILSDHPLHQFIIGGDLNTELRGHSPFDQLWSNFVTKYDLLCCDQFNNNNNNNNNNNFTYFHDSLNQRKWIDHFLVSASIAPSTENHCILDLGDNTSDHHPIKLDIKCNIQAEPEKIIPPAKSPSLKWEKCTQEQKTNYSNRLAELLHRSHSVIKRCNIAHCQRGDCIASLQMEYDNLTQIINVADKVLPRHKPGVEKHWWTSELTALRNQCMEIHRLWLLEEKPRSGPTNDERCRVRAAYKRAIRHAQKKPKQDSWNRLHNTLSSKSTTEFWKSWRKLYCKNQSDLHTVVNGVTSKTEIAESFKNHFVKVSEPNNRQRVDRLNDDFRVQYQDVLADHGNCSCSSHYISLNNVIDAAFSMQKGKCSDDSSIHAEHIFNAPMPLFTRMEDLFNGMLLHGFVPSQFQRGTIVPIVKDRSGDKGEMNNHWGITIAPIISKVFEHALHIVFQSSLTTSAHQFGFKRKSSTSLAIHCLKETINYYTSHGSNVNCSFLDASKAFDRLVHAGLFTKLLQRQVPLILLNVIIAWYADLQCRVRWGDTFSQWFEVKAGVRQGGILSPSFYSIYVDELVEVLSKIGIGCHLRGVFLSILLYADDMALTAPSLKGLQILISATEEYCQNWDIMLNSKKTKNLSFGKKTDLPPLTLDGKSIEWVDSWTYLGVKLQAHRQFNCDIDGKVKSFYRCANAILRIDGRSDEMVMLQLMESQCISILTYAVEVIHVADRDQRRRLRVAYNSIFRRIFGYRNWESVTNLQHALHRPTWEELIVKRTANFMKSVAECPILSLITHE